MLRRTSTQTRRLATVKSRLFSTRLAAVKSAQLAKTPAAKQLVRSPLPLGEKAEQLIKYELVKSSLIADENTVSVQPFKAGAFYWGSSYAIKIGDESQFVASFANMENQNNLPFSVLASQQGVFPKIHQYNPDVTGNNKVGMIIRDHIKDKGTRQHLEMGALTSIGGLIRKFGMMKPASTLSTKESAIFESYYRIAEQKYNDPVIQKILIRYDQLKAKLESSPNYILHGDLHIENVLFDGSRSWLLDLEFARKASALAPLIDIATMSFSLNSKQEKELLTAAYGSIHKELLVDYLKAKELARLRYCFIYIGLRENYLRTVPDAEKPEPLLLEKYQSYTQLIKSYYDLSVEHRTTRLRVESGLEHPWLENPEERATLRASMR